MAGEYDILPVDVVGGATNDPRREAVQYLLKALELTPENAAKLRSMPRSSTVPTRKSLAQSRAEADALIAKAKSSMQSEDDPIVQRAMARLKFVKQYGNAGPQTLANVVPAHVLRPEAASRFKNLNGGLTAIDLNGILDDPEVLQLMDSWIDPEALQRAYDDARFIAERQKAAAQKKSR